MNYKEAYDITMPQKKREEEKFNTWVRFVVRPLSIIITLPLIKTKIRPTSITIISIVICILGFFLTSFSNQMIIRIIGWFCFFLWAIFDGVDGNLARCTNRCSSNGDLWDTMGGYLALVFLMFSSGIVSFYDNNAFELLPKYMYLIFGGAAALFTVFPRLMHQKKEANRKNEANKGKYSDAAGFNLVERIAGNLTAPSGIMQVFFLCAIVFHFVNIYLLIYCLIYFGIMMLSLKEILKEE